MGAWMAILALLAAVQVQGVEYTRRVIYESPEKPRYSSWVGAWIMPDESLMICFTRCTGPVEGRPRAPEIWQKMGLTDPKRDFTGLDRRVIYMRSTDAGATWQETGAAPFGGPTAHACGGGAHIALKDGALLRRLHGWDLMPDPDVPHTGFLQRSEDLGKTWGQPQLLLDPAKYCCQLTRIRRLRDGRLLAGGDFAEVPAGSVIKERYHLLMVSDDDGKTWERVEVIPRDHPGGAAWANEWDFAELESGDLLCVFRRFDPQDRRKQVRWQGTLRRDGKTWKLSKAGPAVFPHSGHPELLATREGPVLHIATTGIHGTTDGGETWTPVAFPQLKQGYRSNYYPRSVQAKDGRVYVFSHVGGDDDYGERDQAIVMQTFRLAAK